SGTTGVPAGAVRQWRQPGGARLRGPHGRGRPGELERGDHPGRGVRPSSGRDPLQARSTGVRLLPGDRAAATWTSSASLEHPRLVGRPGLTNRAGGRAADGLTDSVAYILIAANATNLPGALTRRGRGGSRASDGG